MIKRTKIYYHFPIGYNVLNLLMTKTMIIFILKERLMYNSTIVLVTRNTSPFPQFLDQRNASLFRLADKEVLAPCRQ